jgi:uncharacterized protein (DUF1501 family)
MINKNINLGRRLALRGGVAAGITIGFGNAWSLAAAPARDGRLIVIFLRGALDGLHTFAPVDDPAYATLRPNLSRGPAQNGIRLTGTGFAAHPSARGMAELYNTRELLFSPVAGTTDASRSHFQAQDIFELGSGNARGNGGFMARLADALGQERPGIGPISFTREVPLAFQGARVQPEIAPLSGSGLNMPDGPALDAIRAAHRGRRTGEAIELAIGTQNRIQTAMDMDGAARSAAPANDFTRIGANMGRILRSNPRLALAFLDLGGFDTHASQDAMLTRSLEQVSSGLLGLRDTLGAEQWARTRVVVMSEFGRTVRENGTQGTDHGHGGLALVAGGNLSGGRMIGGFDGLTGNALNEGRDLPVRVDWRDLIADVSRSVWGLGERSLDSAFPGRPRKATIA